MSAFFVELTGYVASFLKQNEYDFNVRYVTSFENLEEQLKSTTGKVILFSNFPPDSAYSNIHLVTARKSNDNFIVSSKPDGYSKTRLQFAYLLDQFKQVTLEIITGAPFAVISNFDIISLSSEGRVFVQRKQEWLPSDNYHQDFADHVINCIKRHITGKKNPYEKIKFYQQRFSRTKAIFFGEKGDKFTSQILQLILSNLGQMSINPYVVDKLETVHQAIVDAFPELIVIVDIQGKKHDALREMINVKTIKFILVTSVKTGLENQENFHEVFMEPHVNYEFSHIFNPIEKMLSNNLTEEYEDGDNKKILLKYCNILKGSSRDSFNDANNYLTKVQHRLIESAKKTGGFSIFASANSTLELEKYVKILSVISPYSLLTYSPNENNIAKEGEKVQIQKLWDLPGSQMGFLSTETLESKIIENVNLLEAGNVQFVPSPSLYAFTESDWESLGLAPEQAQKTSGWFVSSDPLVSFPAASIGANFSFNSDPNITVLDEALAKICELKIPYVDSYNNEELSKFLLDEQDSLSAFHIHAARVIDECRNSIDKDSLGRILNRFEKEILEGVKEHNSNIARLKRTNAISLVSGTILTASFTILSTHGIVIPQTLAAFTGTGGAVGVLGNALAYLNELQNIKNNEFHFFWKLRK